MRLISQNVREFFLKAKYTTHMELKPVNAMTRCRWPRSDWSTYSTTVLRGTEWKQLQANSVSLWTMHINIWIFLYCHYYIYNSVYVPWSINKLFLFLCIFLAAEKRFPLCFFIVFFASLCVQYSPVCKRTYPCNIMACIVHTTAGRT